MGSHESKKEIKQADKPCQCGSWYRENDKCNICGSHQPVPESFYYDKQAKAIKDYVSTHGHNNACVIRVDNNSSDNKRSNKESKRKEKKW